VVSDPIKLDGVFEKADAALYAVKRSGKGRVLVHGEALSVA
jgi:GGDEF domain-containing protein